ncbi:MAG: hypothetical protein RL172_1446 [Bacteroidota bacterium]
MKQLLLLTTVFISLTSNAQNKKPLDHTVYDEWKSIGERLISNDGNFVVYTVTAQEGDGELVIQNPATRYKKVIARGYNAVITEDSKYLICKIKPFYKDTRQARIKKKKPDEMPKDSLAIIQLGNDSVYTRARIKNYKTPENGAGYLAYQLEKPLPDTSKKKPVQDAAKLKNEQLARLADSMVKKSIDSIKGNITTQELTAIIQKATRQIIKEGKDEPDADGDDALAASNTEGGELFIRNIQTGKETSFKSVSEYHFDKMGNRLLLEIPKKNKDSNSKAMLVLYQLATATADTIFKGFNDAKNFAMDENGTQLAFVAERDSSEKSLVKFYKLWYYRLGLDSSILIADKNTVGMQLGYTVSEHAAVQFSKDGQKLFFGTAPLPVAKDTTLVDFELARLDVWHYKDDYLQTQQLKNLDAELKRSHLAVYHTREQQLVQLGSTDMERTSLVDEGNADWILAQTNMGNRVQGQWQGRTQNTAYLVNTHTGQRTLIFKNLFANAAASPGGRFAYWYNPEAKQYFTYEITSGITRNVTEKIPVALYDEENDMPDFASPYGVMGWMDKDSALLLYDKYEVWKTDPAGKAAAQLLLAAGLQARKQMLTCRYVKTNRDERFIPAASALVFRVFDNNSKNSAYTITGSTAPYQFASIPLAPVAVNGLIKAKNSNAFAFTKEHFTASPDMYFSGVAAPATIFTPESFGDAAMVLSHINPQQAAYNWGTAELIKWKTYNGKTTSGILYKPENYDAAKKYPLICYFYEKLTDGLHTYHAPAPTPSRLNISFFVSRGYLVLAPDIAYTDGHPGNSAYDYIASGARALVKNGLADSTRIGIQGQSWGGYQVCYLITKTNLFKAAWAGAPVANMTSAYGGIRWESGLNRQFQYEKSQSRIGATLWEKPQLYIENSPLFHLPKVQTPLVIMHNDADGAVPWYQGIEMFTGLRRLGKPVWMLNYNGEAHNLVERRNRKDIQIREQQFFDWMLKGEKPAKWLTDGVPAVDKGKDWGLEIE